MSALPKAAKEQIHGKFETWRSTSFGQSFHRPPAAQRCSPPDQAERARRARLPRWVPDFRRCALNSASPYFCVSAFLSAFSSVMGYKILESAMDKNEDQ